MKDDKNSGKDPHTKSGVRTDAGANARPEDGDGSTQTERDEAATKRSTGRPSGNSGTEASRGTSG